MVVSTRSLVLSSVGGDGLLRAEPLFAVAEQASHTEKALRDCLARLVRDGLLNKVDGRGRAATYRATESGLRELDTDHAWAAFGHRIDAGLEPWDGSWHLIGFEIPEKRRAARDAIRSVAIELGATPVQGGLYVYAHDLSPFIRPIAERTGFADAITTMTTDDLRVGSTADRPGLTARLWDLDELHDRYRRIAADLAELLKSTARSEADFAAAMFRITFELEDALRLDPHLPLELLPTDWPAPDARRRFRAALAVAPERSALFGESQAMQSVAAEIDRALDESSSQFWGRWTPRVIEAYSGRLPVSALPSAAVAA